MSVIALNQIETVVVSDDGETLSIEDRSVAKQDGAKLLPLPRRAMLPGMVDVHSHSFQRTIRGSVESREKAGPNFWSWRDAMYRAAGRFDPEELGTIARMAFLEMALAGITTVGEFHYVHRDRDGSAYANPNEIGLQIVRRGERCGDSDRVVARGLCSGWIQQAAGPRAETVYRARSGRVSSKYGCAALGARDVAMGWPGSASRRIVFAPCRLEYLREVTVWARAEKLPVHMHVAEQPAENSACIEEYGCTPFALLDREGILDERLHGDSRNSSQRRGDRRDRAGQTQSSALARRPSEILAMEFCPQMH